MTGPGLEAIIPLPSLTRLLFMYIDISKTEKPSIYYQVIYFR